MQRTKGEIRSPSGSGWLCLPCAAEHVSPLDLDALPTLAVVHGLSMCAVHAMSAILINPPPGTAPDIIIDAIIYMDKTGKEYHYGN